MERRELTVAPELGQQIAEIFRGLRDFLIAAAESEFETELAVRSRCLSMVIVEEPTQSLGALHRPLGTRVRIVPEHPNVSEAA
jgi:hypothetical protein